MKPKSKIEKHYVALAERLPDLSQDVVRWAESTVFEDNRVGYYSRKHGDIWCMCCGRVGRSTGSPLADALVYECPGCGRQLSVYRSHPRQEMHVRKWFYIVDIFEGVQVVRMFEASRWNDTPGRDTIYTVVEVWQRWLTQEGREVITCRPYYRTYNSTGFRYSEPYGIGDHNYSANGYYIYQDMFALTDYRMYPKVRISALLRRNGCSATYLKHMERCHVDVFEAMQRLLTDNILETLVKVRQKALAVYYMKEPTFNMRDYMHAVNICTRNGYVVKDADMWLDYIHALIITGRDSHNAVYVCPQNLRQAHDRLMERIGVCPHDHEDKEGGFAERAARYRSKMQAYAGLKIKGEGFYAAPVMNLPSLRKEGEEMHHCVFRMKYDKKNSLILSVRDRTRKKKRIATVEVGLDKFVILQCRGVNNNVPPFYEKICEAVRDNMDAIRRCANG